MTPRSDVQLSDAWRRPGRVLVTGTDQRARGLVLELLEAVFPIRGTVECVFSSTLPENGLGRFDAILLDGRVTASDRVRLEVDPELAWRTRLLIDARGRGPHELRRLTEIQGPLSSLLIGAIHDRQTREDLAALLLCEPAARRIDSLLKDLCTPEQHDILMRFVRTSWSRKTELIAARSALSPRSMRRLCFQVGLLQPQDLHRASRVLLAVAWWVRHRSREEEIATCIAGYAAPSSFRRAAEASFGVSWTDVSAAWMNDPDLAPLLRKAVLR
jgi:hypothetical protein